MTDQMVNDSINNLSRIAQAATRMMADLAWRGKLADPEEEIGHMQANLDHLRRMLEEAR